jgi:hypothetical protein
MSTSEFYDGFRVYTIFTFVMPEYASSTGDINKHYRMDEFLEKLKDGIPLNETLEGFNSSAPVFDYKKVYDRYEDRFWTMFWRRAPTKVPAHFPMAMNLQGQIERKMLSQDTVGDVAGSPPNVAPNVSYRSNLQCYFFPYGAVSLRLCEIVVPQSGCSSKQIVNFINQDLIWNGKSYTIRSFFQELRESIISQVIKKRLNIPYSGAAPQYYLIVPGCEKSPDPKENWKSMATLLAMSGQDNFIAKYDVASYPNCGKDGQQILIGPRSCVIFTPPSTFHNAQDGLDCLCNRLMNLSDLSIIQNEFINKFRDDYKQLLTIVGSTSGYSLKEVEQAIRNEFNYNVTDSIGFLKLIMQLQDPLVEKAKDDSDAKRWLNWYLAVFNQRKTSIESFLALLDQLNAANVKLHDDVKESVNGLIKLLLSIFKSGSS